MAGCRKMPSRADDLRSRAEQSEDLQDLHLGAWTCAHMRDHVQHAQVHMYEKLASHTKHTCASTRSNKLVHLHADALPSL